MAARTCLLCGKALSRIWAGTGEDFCSREHRNQYRLRRGMDRLLEANRVASVMRRREQPKNIPACDLCVEGPADPRGFLDPLASAPPPPIYPISQFEGRPGLESASDYLNPRGLAGSVAERREPGEAARFAQPRLRTPETPIRQTAHVVAAPPTGVRPRRAAPAERRAVDMRWITTRKASAAILLARSGKAAGSLMAQARPPRSVALGNAGVSLRVCTAAAFRFRDKVLPSTHATPAGGSLILPGVKDLTRPTAPAKAEAAMLAVEVFHSAARIPAAPEPILERRFHWPEALEMTFQFRNTANGWRMSAIPFGSPDESVAKERK